MAGLRVATHDRIAVLTLDRPPRNELDTALLDALRRALAAADADEDVDAIVLTGAGEHFCGGLDLEHMADEAHGRGLAERVFGGWRIWSPLTKPVIGAINGPTERGGLELALQCDILLASDRASFADTHTSLGVVPALGLSALLARAVGHGWARRMSLTGQPVDAALAERIGLVTEVVAADALLPAALGVATAIAGNDRNAVRSLLATYRGAGEAQVREALAIERTGLRRALEESPASPVRDIVLAVVTGDGGAPGGADTPPR